MAIHYPELDRTELREMPSSLNDARRKLDMAYAENKRLRAALVPIVQLNEERGSSIPVDMIERAYAALGDGHQQQVEGK